MAVIKFTYAGIDPQELIVETGANEISWSYALNTVSYPTYAGEVVQVLSTKIDNLTIQGDVQSYAKMEEIYRWFLMYITSATVGDRSEEPMTMEYPHRGWKMKIQPNSLPGLMYGRDIVVPRWQMQAHIVEADAVQQELTIDAATAMDFSVNEGQLTEFGTLTADIGFRQANPFSDPLGVLTKAEAKLWPDYKKSGVRVEGEESGEEAMDALMDTSKRLSGFLKQYLNLDFSNIWEIMEDVSKPATTTKNDKDAQDKPDQKKSAGKKKR